MAVQLDEALQHVRDLLLDEAGLVRAVASGRRRNTQPRWRRAELRYVELKSGRHLQVTAYDETQAFTANHAGDDRAAAVDDLLATPFSNWHVETTTGTLQLRVTKKGQAMAHRSAAAAAESTQVDLAHDRSKQRLLPPHDPVLRVLGIADENGRVKPSRQAKYRQVEEFLRALDAAIGDAVAAGALRTPTEDAPLRLVDLGCGNAYLTFAAHRYLREQRGMPVRVLGVDVKEQSLRHNTEVAAQLGVQDEVAFLQGTIGDLSLGAQPDVVLALHACDTATDDALAQALRWHAALVLAAPCCHHDVSAQLRSALRQDAPDLPSLSLVRDGILRERFADTLTDALRAATLRTQGYRVDVVEFVESKHTPRNTLLRAVRTGRPDESAARELDDLATAWHVRPRLQELLG